ncbi:MAG: hypothetical protein HBSAPP03_24400 [Phycisphaerae bacterium]|nr:MAG: hypothetical protein HBSAPP03_24400 [Phycisphaerae bacterium]
MITRLFMAAVVVLATWSVSVQGQSTPTPPVPAMRLVLAEDLDCEAAVAEFEAALREARAQRVGLLVVELGGNESRLDLVNRMGAVLRDVELPTVAWLDGGEDQRVGPGQAALALFAQRVLVRDRLVIAGSARNESELLVESPPPWDVIVDELHDRLLARLDPRAAKLAWPLVGRLGTGFIVTGEGASRVEIAEVIPPAGRSITRDVDGRVALSMTAKDMHEVGVAEAVLRDWSAASKHLKVGPRVITRQIDVSATRTRAEAERSLTRIGDQTQAAERALDLPDPSRRSVAPSRYREAAGRARRSLDEAESALDALEAALVRVPEVMRTPAPGQGRLDRPSGYATKWRSLIRGHRSDHARLDTKARLFAAQ